MSFCLTLSPYLPRAFDQDAVCPLGRLRSDWHAACNKRVATVGWRPRPCRPPDDGINLLARGASDEWDTAVALPLTAVSSQNVIGSFEARFFFRAPKTAALKAELPAICHWDAKTRALDKLFANRPHRSLRSISYADLPQDVLHVLFDRLIADAQGLRDLLVRQAERQLLQDFILALG